MGFSFTPLGNGIFRTIGLEFIRGNWMAGFKNGNEIRVGLCMSTFDFGRHIKSVFLTALYFFWLQAVIQISRSTL